MAQNNTGIFYESSMLPRLKKYDQLIIFYESGDIIDYVVKQSKDAGYVYLCDTGGKLSVVDVTKLNRIQNVAYLPNAKPASYKYTRAGKLAGVILEDGTKLHCTKVLVMKGE